MPKLRLRAVSLRIETSEGTAGRDVVFGPGLTVIRADNSSGKSTVLQAVIYALGLEGMLSASRDIPLPHSVTDYVEIEGKELKVLRSSVRLEVSNGAGDVVTLQRSIVDPVRENGLIRVEDGAALTSPGVHSYRDFFVRRAGAAQREAGFHRFLAEFVGWKLPTVTKFDGSEVPLYLECLFPYFYVEQKHGWSGVQARIPTYLGIRDVAKRSPEYLLDLEIFQRTLVRQRLRAAASQIEADWQGELSAYVRTADAAGVVLGGIPDRIGAEFAPDQARPRLFIDDGWREMDEGVARLRSQLEALESRGTPTVGDASDQLETQLEARQGALERTLAAYAAVEDELGEHLRRDEQLELRLEALRDDAQKHRDAAVLERLGSSQGIAMLAEHVCPTCHQELLDGAQVSNQVMTTAQSIDFIDRQVVTFRAMKEDGERVINASRARLTSLRELSRQQRSDIRALRDTLTGRNSAPSLADLSVQVSLRQRIEKLEDRRLDLARHRSRLERIHKQWRDNRELLRGYADEGLTARDMRVISELETELRMQLTQYHFRSLPPSAVEISRETYRPAHEGFDLGFDLSASDMIRVIWAYLISFMHASRFGVGNHPGLLMFDEPRQQETARGSYQELLRRVASEAGSGAQIVIATSEPEVSLREMMGTSAYHLISAAPGEKLLRLL